MENLIKEANYAIADKKFVNGVQYYTQDYCKVSLTDDGYRIYRPANRTGTTQATNPVWGGLRLQIHENMYQFQKGHTYIIKFHVKGKSSNAPTTIGFSNNMGWGGGGLNPSPSNVSYRYTPANFDGELECFYKWTINDDIYKVCTSSYSSFVQGTTYLSYKDFQFGFVYQDTGALGTELYLNNFRMYDITNAQKNVGIYTNGVAHGGLIFETNEHLLNFYGDNEISGQQFYEK